MEPARVGWSELGQNGQEKESREVKTLRGPREEEALWSSLYGGTARLGVREQLLFL